MIFRFLLLSAATTKRALPDSRSCIVTSVEAIFPIKHPVHIIYNNGTPSRGNNGTAECKEKSPWIKEKRRVTQGKNRAPFVERTHTHPSHEPSSRQTSFGQRQNSRAQYIYHISTRTPFFPRSLYMHFRNRAQRVCCMMISQDSRLFHFLSIHHLCLLVPP